MTGKKEKKEEKEEKKEEKEEKKEKKEEKKEKKEEKKEKKEEKEEKKEKKEEKKEKKEEEVEVITAVFKVNIHCRECAREIKKPLLKTQGIYSVDIDCEKGEVKVKGEFDVIKIYEKIKKLSKKKVELISPKMEEVLKKKKEEAEKEKEKEKESKEEIIRIISVKVHLHCEKCELDLRKKLLKQKGIYSVKTDMKAEILTIKGTIEPEKLLKYIRKKVHKHAEIIDSKIVKKKEKKEEEEKKKEKKKEKKEEEKVEDIKKTEIIEFKEEIKVEVKSKEDGVPYFIHYVYAPQYFSDENPNACIVM